ncbi:MAG: hypothetical protein U0931_03745 [Vulcanimicrobiota bacterium]
MIHLVNGLAAPKLRCHGPLPVLRQIEQQDLALPQESVTLLGSPPSLTQQKEKSSDPEKQTPPPPRLSSPPVPSTLMMLMESTPPEVDSKPQQSALSQSLVGHFHNKLAQNPKAQDVLKSWTPEQRAQLDGLLAHPCMEASFLHTGPHTPGKAMEVLPGLIASGRLLNQDRNGKTTLDHLCELQGQTLEHPLENGVVTCELLANLANPGEINQRNRGTCTVTTIEYFHCSQQPSDYTRLVKELVKQDAEAHFQSGKVCWTNPTGLKDDHSKRSSVDRVYQSSMMQAAYDGRALYNNLNDSFWTIGWTRQWRDSGLSHQHSGYLLEQALGCKHEVMEYQGNQKRFEADILRAHNLGQQVFVAMRWSPDKDDVHANHALAIEKIEGDKVYLRNPWGDGETGGDNGPPRQLVGEHGQVVMSKSDFFDRLNGAIRPQRNFFNVWANRIRYHFGGEKAILKG